MSLDRCHDCERLVDTDDDPECYVEVGNMRRLHKTICLCEFCRDERENDADWGNFDTPEANDLERAQATILKIEKE